MDFIERIFTDFSEIHGDRAYGDDEAVACGMARLGDEEVMVIGNRKGGSTKERVRRNFGMPHPEGYRKALRCMKIAEKFGRPVISLHRPAGRLSRPGRRGAGPGGGHCAQPARDVAAARAHDFSHHRRGRIGRSAGAGRQRPRADSGECALLCDYPGELRGHHVARRGAQAVGGRGHAHLRARGCQRWAAWTRLFPSRREARTPTARRARVAGRRAEEAPGRAEGHARRKIWCRAAEEIPQHRAVLYGRLDAHEHSPERLWRPVRAYVQFVAAVLYFFLAEGLARHRARGLASEQWFPLAEQAILVFLLLLGYAGMGFWLNRQMHPLSEQGLPRRHGLAVPRRGWDSPWAGRWPWSACCRWWLVGGIAIVLELQPSAWGWLLADAAFFALAALVEEIAFRGYGFQRFAHAVGPARSGAGLCGVLCHCAGASAGIEPRQRCRFCGAQPGALYRLPAHPRSVAKLGTQLRMEGQPRAGLRTGGERGQQPFAGGAGRSYGTVLAYRRRLFGLDGSWVTFVVLLAALPVVFRVTRDLDFRYNAPVIVPGGIPVDLDAAARRQHEAAMGKIKTSQLKIMIPSGAKALLILLDLCTG
jgi:uncharacterized protein